MDFPAIGELNRLVRLQSRTDVPVFESDVAPQMSGGRDRWAKIEPVGGGIYYGSVQTDTTVTHRIWMRYDPGVDANSEVDDGESLYRVRRVTNLRGANRFTLLDVEEIGNVE